MMNAVTVLRIASFLLVTCLALAAGPCRANQADVREMQTGIASYYGDGWDNQPTASGELFDQTVMTAAHPTLPLGAWVRVTNLRNGRSVNVRINDRNSRSSGRIIDLSRAAAEAVGMVRSGLARVRIERILPGVRRAGHAAYAMITMVPEPPRKPVL